MLELMGEGPSLAKIRRRKSKFETEIEIKLSQRTKTTK